MNNNHILHASIFLTVLFAVSCKKLIEVEKPIDKYVKEEVFSSTETAVSAITGLYAGMSADIAGGIGGISLNAGLLADEYARPPEFRFKDFEYSNNVTSNSGWGFWDLIYKTYIYRINSIIEGVKTSAVIPAETQTRLIGEAKFTRAVCYFYLVNFYGEVPLVLTTDYKANSNIHRASIPQVYSQIIQDLTDAQQGLTDEYLAADLQTVSFERVRPNKNAATAMLARVHLFSQNWNKAEVEASKVIEMASVYELTDLNVVFLKNSREAIWQLQPNPKNVDGNTNTPDATLLYMPAFEDPFSISTFLMNAFEAGDQRKDLWIANYPTNGTNYLVPNKYKIGARRDTDPVQMQSEYTMVLRLAEMYLIRAEARVHLGDLEGAKADLDAIRVRAGLGEMTISNQELLLVEVFSQRRIELFSEWGHRWLDLKRSLQVDAIMSQITPLKTVPGQSSTWQSYKSLLPIPITEFRYNPKLRGHQNPGYSEQ